MKKNQIPIAITCLLVIPGGIFFCLICLCIGITLMSAIPGEQAICSVDISSEYRFVVDRYTYFEGAYERFFIEDKSTGQRRQLNINQYAIFDLQKPSYCDEVDIYEDGVVIIFDSAFSLDGGTSVLVYADYRAPLVSLAQQEVEPRLRPGFEIESIVIPEDGITYSDGQIYASGLVEAVGVDGQTNITELEFTYDRGDWTVSDSN